LRECYLILENTIQMNNLATGVCACLQTGQRSCHDNDGSVTPCQGSGQDAEFCSGQAWPETRFSVQGKLVDDGLTGLVWTQDANLAEFPCNWDEALEHIAAMNATEKFGFSDWRLPNRRELRSLISHQTRRPALPEGHPFSNVFASWYWSSTTAAGHPDHAWYLNLDGGRMFYGGKDQAYMLWPVRGSGDRLACSGQVLCYDRSGQEIACLRTGQDGEYRCGSPWPQPRFETQAHAVLDRLTGLLWSRSADLADGPVTWDEALAKVAQLNAANTAMLWRLPNINELESLVDCSTYQPALPEQHPFTECQDVYWSSTTSLYEPDWAWALYLDKGAVGVGQKSFARFYVWAVAQVITADSI
jgi:hypothetical protein